MITTKWYTLAAQTQWSGNPINWVNDTIHAALISSGYTPNQDADQFFATPATHEISGTGYTPGGQPLQGKTVGGPVATHSIPLLANMTTWLNVNLTFRYAVVYRPTGNDNTSLLLGYVDFGVDQSVSGGNLVLSWDQTYGVLTAQAN